MKTRIKRREFLKVSSGAGLLLVTSHPFAGARTSRGVPGLISPGCRGTRVKVARIFMGNPEGLWPKPDLDFRSEVRFYESKFKELQDEFSDVEFIVDELITRPEQLHPFRGKLNEADGILVIHLSLQTMPILREILAVKRPTAVFSAPYSGHEWSGFGQLRKEELGAKLECFLTSDYTQLGRAIRPFRAIHHLREARILNLSSRVPDSDFLERIRGKFGTQVVQIDRERALKAFEAVDETRAKAEADRWIRQAVKVIEPSRDEIVKSCRLGLAFEQLLNEEKATVFTVDCYGTMYQKLPAYPCMGFTRLNDLGLGGICESDLRSALTHVLFQGLVGRPGFISDPTVDESNDSIILAHCLGSTRMDGPEGPAAPYKVRTIMERREGAVTQVQMRVGQKVTQALFANPDLILYFTGTIVETPEVGRGCRTKIRVTVDGDTEQLWKDWSHGLHRQTCYGDIVKELSHFCRYQEIQLVDEAAAGKPASRSVT